MPFAAGASAKRVPDGGVVGSSGGRRAFEEIPVTTERSPGRFGRFGLFRAAGRGKAKNGNEAGTLLCMKFTTHLAAAACVLTLLSGCGEKSSAPPASTNAADINNPLVNAKRVADKTIDVSYLNQALQLFNVQEGRYPKTLEELTPKYVAQLPTPPLGYQLKYDPVKGEATVVRQ
jgi:hypothetical protein